MTERLILASGSSARARLLAAAGLEFSIELAAFDESPLKQVGCTEGRGACR